LDVMTERSVSDVYSAELLATAGQRKCESLAKLKKERNDKDVTRTLKDLESAAGKEEENLMPYIIECVKAYATLQEICDVMRDVFGEYKTGNI